MFQVKHQKIGSDFQFTDWSSIDVQNLTSFDDSEVYKQYLL